MANPAVNDASAFHVYAIDWNSAQILWTIDGVQTHVIDTTPATLEEFRKPFHVIFNLAFGGTYPGQTPAQSQFPLTASVDYLRYYQDAGTGGNAAPVQLTSDSTRRTVRPATARVCKSGTATAARRNTS